MRKVEATASAAKTEASPEAHTVDSAAREELMRMRIEEELRWVYVIYRFGKPWSEHPSRELAEAAMANIQRNEAACEATLARLASGKK